MLARARCGAPVLEQRLQGFGRAQDLDEQVTNDLQHLVARGMCVLAVAVTAAALLGDALQKTQSIDLMHAVSQELTSSETNGKHSSKWRTRPPSGQQLTPSMGGRYG